jgi:dTDP-4-dehydrorhamnose 3,5-epimerase
MKIIQTEIPDVLRLEPVVYGDNRGFFMESFNARDFARETGIDRPFVQDNHSRSSKNVLRGCHYQRQHPQGKLVRVVKGSVFDVAIDMRRSSPTFGKWTGCELSEDNKRLFWIPEGFAHGFLVLSDSADFLYKTTDYYAPGDEQCMIWNDPTVGIQWPLAGDPVMSAKDLKGVPFGDLDVFD